MRLKDFQKTEIFLLFGIFFLAGCISLDIIKDRLPEPHKVNGGILFQVDSPSAKTVYIAGEFNSWQRPPDQKGISMVKNPATLIWEKVVDIKPGRYQYKIVIDNNAWILDQNNPLTYDDGRGNVNSLIIVNE